MSATIFTDRSVVTTRTAPDARPVGPNLSPDPTGIRGRPPELHTI